MVPVFVAAGMLAYEWAPRCGIWHCCGENENQDATEMEDFVSMQWDEEECVTVAFDGVWRQASAASPRCQEERSIPWASSLVAEPGALSVTGPGSCGSWASPQRSHSASLRGRVPAAGAPVSQASLRVRGAVSASARVNPLSSFGFMTLAVPACDYKIQDPSDPIDQQMARELQSLEPEATSAFTLRRLAPSRYEIDSRVVSLHWGDNSDLFVHEDALKLTAEEEGGGDTPLALYLSDMASIAMRVRRPLKQRTLTFVGQDNVVGEDRFASMQIACKQARLREEAAEAYPF